MIPGTTNLHKNNTPLMNKYNYEKNAGLVLDSSSAKNNIDTDDY